MRAHRANLRRLLAHHEVTAVAALPHGLLALFKDLLHLHIGKQRAVALLVALLDLADLAELLRQGGKALLLRFLREGGVHVGPFVVLALGGGSKVLRGIAQRAQRLEPHLRVLLLILCGLQEDRRNLLVALLLGDGGKIGVLIARFGLAGERGHQVLFRLAALQLHGVCPPFLARAQDTQPVVHIVTRPPIVCQSNFLYKSRALVYNGVEKTNPHKEAVPWQV